MSGTVQGFFWILVASFAFTTVLSRIPWLRIPSAVGYLAFGVLLHTGFVHLGEEESRWLTELGDIGLMFLMFLSGIEVDIRLMKPESWRNSKVNPMYLAASIFFSTLLVSWLMSLVIVHWTNGANPWMLTLLFATTSLGIILPVLEETNWLHSDYGQVLLLSALFADLFTMLLISLFISARTSGALHDFVLTLTVIPLAFAVYLILHWVRNMPTLRTWAGDLQNRMRGIVAMVAAFCAIADFTGSEPIVGSFLVGILVSALPFAFKKTVRDYCHGLGYGFLIPVFFISVGLNFNVEVMSNPSSWVWVPVLIAIAFVVKLLPSWQLRRAFGKRLAIAGGLLLSARLSLIVAAADIGVRIGALPQTLSQSIIIVAVVTCLLSPILFVSLV